MSYSPWQHLGSVTFAACTLSSFPFSSPTLQLLLLLPKSCPQDLAFAGNGFDTKVSLMAPGRSESVGFRLLILRGAK